MQLVPIDEIKEGMVLGKSVPRIKYKGYLRKKGNMLSKVDVGLIENQTLFSICVDHPYFSDIKIKDNLYSEDHEDESFRLSFAQYIYDYLCNNDNDIKRILKDIQTGNIDDSNNTKRIIKRGSTKVMRRSTGKIRSEINDQNLAEIIIGARDFNDRFKIFDKRNANFVEEPTTKNYIVLHSLESMIFMRRLGKFLGYMPSETELFSNAALMHDFGMDHRIICSENIDNRKEIIKNHEMIAKILLKEKGNKDSRVYKAIEKHHQASYDRYIKGKTGDLIDMLQVIDSYSELSKFYPKHAVIEGIRHFSSKDDGLFDPEISDAFFSIVQPYPRGSEIVLDKQEIAVVHKENDKDYCKPVVRIIDKGYSERFLNGELVDLKDIKENIILKNRYNLIDRKANKEVLRSFPKELVSYIREDHVKSY